jgi:hypothetical protein
LQPWRSEGAAASLVFLRRAAVLADVVGAPGSDVRKSIRRGVAETPATPLTQSPDEVPASKSTQARAAMSMAESSWHGSS